MALKKTLSSEDFSSLDESLKAHYAEKDGAYVLDLEGDDTGALKRAKDRESAAAREAKAKVAELQAQIDELQGNDAKKRGDIASLEKSWNAKIEAQKAEYDAKLNEANSFIKTSLVDNVALKIAQQISTAPAVVLPHLKARLAAEMENGQFQTRVLDANGKPSAMTPDDLAKEFVANKDFSAIMIASKASGGAGAGRNTAPSGMRPVDAKPVDLSKLNPTLLVEHMRSIRGE